MPVSCSSIADVAGQLSQLLPTEWAPATVIIIFEAISICRTTPLSVSATNSFVLSRDALRNVGLLSVASVALPLSPEKPAWPVPATRSARPVVRSTTSTWFHSLTETKIRSPKPATPVGSPIVSEVASTGKEGGTLRSFALSTKQSPLPRTVVIICVVSSTRRTLQTVRSEKYTALASSFHNAKGPLVVANSAMPPSPLEIELAGAGPP